MTGVDVTAQHRTGTVPGSIGACFWRSSAVTPPRAFLQLTLERHRPCTCGYMSSVRQPQHTIWLCGPAARQPRKLGAIQFKKVVAAGAQSACITFAGRAWKESGAAADSIWALWARLLKDECGRRALRQPDLRLNTRPLTSLEWSRARDIVVGGRMTGCCCSGACGVGSGCICGIGCRFAMVRLLLLRPCLCL